MRISHFLVSPSGDFPGNPTLPAIVYAAALEPAGDLAAEFEERFAAAGWARLWRNGIFDYHHYHGTAHEALGIARGTVTVRLGGPEGRAVNLKAGDAVVIPAGVSHCNEVCSGDLLVVGCYPPGQTDDMNTGRPEELPAAEGNIAAVPKPGTDPLFGATGPLRELWNL